MLPREVTLAVIDGELPGAVAWAGRNDVKLSWVPADLAVEAVLTQPCTGERFYLRGEFDSYRELPPTWQFFDASWKLSGMKAHYPAPSGSPLGGSTLFHGKPVICAPFNRLAYGIHGGPHKNWADPVQWETVAPDRVSAPTLGEMLAVLHAHLQRTEGRMG